MLQHMRARTVDHGECGVHLNGDGASGADVFVLSPGKNVQIQLKQRGGEPIDRATTRAEFLKMGAQYLDGASKSATLNASDKSVLVASQLVIEVLNCCCARTGSDAAKVNVSRFIIATSDTPPTTGHAQPTPAAAAAAAAAGGGAPAAQASSTAAPTPNDQCFHFGDAVVLKSGVKHQNGSETCFVFDVCVPTEEDPEVAQGWGFSPLSSYSMRQIQRDRHSAPLMQAGPKPVWRVPLPKPAPTASAGQPQP